MHGTPRNPTEAKPVDAITPPGFFSQRVQQARYDYLNLTPSPRAALEVVCGGVEQCRPDYVVRRERFRYFSIEFVAAGRGRLLLNGRPHALGPGVAFCYGPGTPHRIATDPDAPMTKHFIDFTGRQAQALLGRFPPLLAGAVQVSDPLAVADIYEEIHRSARMARPQAGEVCRLLLQILVLRIAELGIDHPNGNARALQTYRRCRTCIDREFLTLKTLSDIARRCHLDPAYLCRVFKRFSGTTPYNYLLRQKMNAAADRLQYSDLLVKEAADALGFSDSFHFSRSFKAVHGIAPQRFIALSRRQ